MINENNGADDAPWQRQLANAVTDPAELYRLLQLSPPEQGASSARKLFALRVPRPFIARMRPGDSRDPLLLQVMTSAREFDEVAGYSTDPLEEQQSHLPGLLHKYGNRVLLIVRGGCAVNCRYCFRRHFPYGEQSANRQQLAATFAYLRANPQINEVILSGGDPLMAKDDYLLWLIGELAAIPSLTRLRVHSRLPVVIPARVTADLLHALTSSRLKPVMVLHINHANEIDDELRAACVRLRQAGIWLLNQSVLLAGINDSAEALVALSEALFSADVQPYYLHQLDKVAGAAHFAVSDSQARQLLASVQRQLPGFLLPRLVREIAGEAAKTPLDLYLEPTLNHQELKPQ